MVPRESGSIVECTGRKFPEVDFGTPGNKGVYQKLAATFRKTPLYLGIWEIENFGILGFRIPKSNSTLYFCLS